MTDMSELIWAKAVPGWHDGETGEDFVGGEFDAGRFKDGVEYIRKDLSDAAIAELVGGLQRAQEELRLIRMKDHGTVYDVMLRTDITALITKYGDKT